MPLANRRRGRGGNGLDAWPGYVDALSTLLLVVIFVLLVFVLGQAFLSVALSGRDRALRTLDEQVRHLSEMLSLERATEAGLHARQAALEASLATSDTALGAARAAAVATGTTIDQLSAQIAALREQLAAIARALELSQTQIAARDVHIADLDRRLNLALASRIAQLERYRSEFFGRLSQVLAGRKGISVVGDRFVFQSEVLFPVGSAALSPAGRAEIDKLADTLRAIAAQIPPDLPWVLRVDGHADRQIPRGAKVDPNWQLSADRAISVVLLLIADGIAPAHLAAAGFAEYQPLDRADTQAAYQKNRRIELRLTDR